MTESFLMIINMSISASWLVLAVLFLRLILNKAPRWLWVTLWGLVSIRLIIPFSIESVFSLLPSGETIRPEIMLNPMLTVNIGNSVLNNTINPVVYESLSPIPGASVNPIQVWVFVFTIIWVSGMILMIAYTAFSYWRLYKRVSTAVPMEQNIYQCDQVESPFILGFFRPRIYLPLHLKKQDIDLIISHEKAHIQRYDHWWKPLGFFLLTIHCFNPLLWFAYVLLCRDIELACDEKVIKKLDKQQRADYSQALLDCSISRRSIAACPLAFGEIGVKERVKRVLHYKKPAFWIVVASFIVSLLVALCFFTDPYRQEIKFNGRIYGQRGSSIYELPEGSEEQGTIIGIIHKTSEQPKEDFYASNLDEKYAGCPIYISGTDYHMIYLYDYSGCYFPFVAESDIKIKNPWVGEYIPGVGNNLGHVDKNQYESISEDFLIGANRYGQAVFQDPHKAFHTFVGLYREGIEVIREEYNLAPISPKDYDLYKKFGWQIMTDSAEIQKQTAFVSSFLDIYENSFIKEVANPHNEITITTTEIEAVELSLNEVLLLSKKGKDLTWADFEGFSWIETGSGLYIRVYEIDKMFSLWIGGPGVDTDPMYIYLIAKDGSDTSVDIRDGAVEDYIEKHKNNPVVTD